MMGSTESLEGFEGGRRRPTPGLKGALAAGLILDSIVPSLAIEVHAMLGEHSGWTSNDQAVTNGPIAPIRPPRPNLGPEPPDADPWLVSFAESIRSRAACWIAGLLALAAAMVVRRRRRLVHASLLARAGEPRPELEARPRARSTSMDLFAREVRILLANQFGPAWLAKTTEEIREHSRSLQGWLSAEDILEMLDLLEEADRQRLSTSTEPGTQEGVLPDRYGRCLDHLRDKHLAMRVMDVEVDSQVIEGRGR